jgi:ribosomal protein S12 methylthiotransferase
MLPTLLERLSNIAGISWIRLHYAYQGLFNDALLHTIANNPKICKYIDMPLQHSEDDILRRMHRPGRQRNTRELLQKIRQTILDAVIRTSMIVGFPGETEAHFEHLLAFVREMKFDRLGVFTYSQEEDTPAAAMPNQVDEHTKERRAAQLMEAQRQVAQHLHGKYIGKTVSVLIERYDGRNDVYIGRSQYDAPEIDGEVFVNGKDIVIGDIVSVRITHALEFDLCGVCA